MVPQRRRASSQATREQLILQTILISLVCNYLAGLVAHGAVFVSMLKVFTFRVQFIVENAAEGLTAVMLMHEEVFPIGPSHALLRGISLTYICRQSLLRKMFTLHKVLLGVAEVVCHSSLIGDGCWFSCTLQKNQSHATKYSAALGRRSCLSFEFK